MNNNANETSCLIIEFGHVVFVILINMNKF